MVTQGQNYITGKKINITKNDRKSTVPVREGALLVMQISQFGNQH
jgi:predicted RNA-binding protein with TRAM domain